MIIKRNIIPTRLQDFVCSVFVFFFIIPFIYWFELYVVIPYFHPNWSAAYIFYWILGHFATFNIVSNLMAIMLCDTSIKGRMMPVNPEPNWRFCASCECFTPPRSWHCNNCRTCILKRDHHCLFTGCCIGHDNYRYFFVFLAYVVIALCVSSIFNTLYIVKTIDFKNLSLLAIVFPLAMLFFDISFMQFCVFMYLVIVVITLIILMLFIFNIDSIKNNQTYADRGFKIEIYNLGVMNNIKSILGERWYLTWISPFVVSKLSQDGINWQTRETEKTK